MVARRVQRLLLGEPDDSGRVLALTYTVKAADELRGRLDARLGLLARRVDSETIHGFAHNLLRTHGTQIGLPLEPELLTRDEDRVELFRSWLGERGESVPDDLQGLFADIDLARARGGEADYLDEWRRALSDNAALDYPELLAKASELLRVDSVRRQIRRLYTSIVVDEAQNLTRAQYELLLTLGADGHSLAIPSMLVGDDKQSIVRFAGADPSLIGMFEMAFAAERHALTTNFRSATVLATAAGKVAAALDHHGGEELAFAAPGQVSIETLPSEQGEGARVAAWVSSLLQQGMPQAALGDGENTALRPEDVAVLCRSAAGLRFVEASLEDRGVPCAVASTPNDWLTTSAARVVLELVGLKGAPAHHSTYWELSRLLGKVPLDESIAAAEAAVAGSDDELVRRVAGVLGLSDVSGLLPYLQATDLPPSLADSEAANWQSDLTQLETTWARFDGLTSRSELSWANFKLFCARAQRGDDLSPGVRLLTVHKAQGREYAAVAIIGLNDGQFPDFRAKTDAALRDELRTFYVAITRPRRILLLTRPAMRDTRYGPRRTEPSRFLDLLDGGSPAWISP